MPFVPVPSVASPASIRASAQPRDADDVVVLRGDRTPVSVSTFPTDRTAPSLRDWGERAGQVLAAVADGQSRTGIDLTGLDVCARELRDVLAGVVTGLGGSAALAAVTVEVATALPPADAVAAINVEQSIRRGVDLAVRLTDARANQLTPALFAEEVAALAAELGLGVRTTAGPGLASGGFGGIAGIGKGSTEPPVLVELWIPGPDGCTTAPPRGAVCLAGKGITFDSGGLSLKTPAAMYGMHTDCAGAAAVLGGMVALAEQGCDTPVYAALPLAENIPGPGSIRPGDVVSTRAGIGLEVVDTDFEGRVVLADALALLAESDPKAVVSLATLTYQAVIALGPDIGAVLARDDVLLSRVVSAAAAGGEPVWPLPWAARYAHMVVSNAPGARVRNHPGNDSGRAITAALMLGEFVPHDVPFAHLDFAGPAVRTTAAGPSATGFGVRTVYELVQGWTV